jgi:hypothetical protein
LMVYRLQKRFSPKLQKNSLLFLAYSARSN